MRSIASGPCLGSKTNGFRSRISLISSTSWEACQKNRYGLIVVPKIATTTVQNSEFADKVGIKNPRAASIQGTFTTITVPKYANSANVSHFKTDTYREYGIKICSTAHRIPNATT